MTPHLKESTHLYSRLVQQSAGHLLCFTLLPVLYFVICYFTLPSFLVVSYGSLYKCSGHRPVSLKALSKMTCNSWFSSQMSPNSWFLIFRNRLTSNPKRVPIHDSCSRTLLTYNPNCRRIRICSDGTGIFEVWWKGGLGWRMDGGLGGGGWREGNGVEEGIPLLIWGLGQKYRVE